MSSKSCYHLQTCEDSSLNCSWIVYKKNQEYDTSILCTLHVNVKFNDMLRCRHLNRMWLNLFCVQKMVTLSSLLYIFNRQYYIQRHRYMCWRQKKEIVGWVMVISAISLDDTGTMQPYNMKYIKTVILFLRENLQQILHFRNKIKCFWYVHKYYLSLIFVWLRFYVPLEKFSLVWRRRRHYR